MGSWFKVFRPLFCLAALVVASTGRADAWTYLTLVLAWRAACRLPDYSIATRREFDRPPSE